MTETDGRRGWMRAQVGGPVKGAGIWAGKGEMGANFILISLCFFSLAFTKAVGSKRGTRLPRMGWESEERRGWGHRSTPPQLQSIPHPPTGRTGQRPVGEGEGRAGRPRLRPPRPLSREEERVAPRPRDVERSRDVEARSSRARGGGTGGVRLLEHKAHCQFPAGQLLCQLLSQASSRITSSPNLQVHPTINS